MSTLQCRIQFLDDTDPFNSTNFPEPVKPPTYTFLTNISLINQIAGVKRLLKAPHKLEDCTLQLYKCESNCLEYGVYLDLDTPLEEQSDELEGFAENKKNSIILRTQITVRVHTIIEKLLNSSGRELRRALFSLKQLFQDDKDLVHQFANSDGLDCLIKVGEEADPNYQNYILRALGQVMLYVDGMNGIVHHNETIQWLYSLIASKTKQVSKSAIKLLLVFVEYDESNAEIFVQAVNKVDNKKGRITWKNVMDVLVENSVEDPELNVYACTLINRVLNGISNQDKYYDVIDALEEQGMEQIIKQGLSNKAADPELAEQLSIYEAVLSKEDGTSLEEGLVRSGTIQDINSIGNLRQVPREKKTESMRKSRRYSIGCSLDTKSNDNSEKRSARHQLRNNCSNNHGTDRVSNDPKWMLYKISKQISQKEDEDTESQMSSSEKSDKDSESSENTSSSLGNMLSRAKQSLGSSRKLNNGNIASIPRAPPKSEADLQWEQIEKTSRRPLNIGDVDFTELTEADDIDYVKVQPGMTGNLGHSTGTGLGALPPMAPMLIHQNGFPPPPPLQMGGLSGHPPPPPPLPPPFMGIGQPPPSPPMLMSNNKMNGPNAPFPPPPPGLTGFNSNLSVSNSNLSKSGKKTIKLHWKEANAEYFSPSGKTAETVWSKMNQELGQVKVDSEKLEQLFASKTVELKTKKQEGALKEITILDAKRSNVINIGLTVLPPPRAIKTAILKMDSAIMNRETIEKILNQMIPTEEEINRITEAQKNKPDIPLGNAEQFFLTLSPISNLSERLQLWLFKLDFDTIENEIAEPMFDLKQGIEELRRSRVLKYILATILTIGNFLNSSDAKGFMVDYLSKLSEVKDTVQKQSLLYHTCQVVIQKFPDSSDLFSEIGAVSRCAKIDWEEMVGKLTKLESDCKKSWEHLEVIIQQDPSANSKNKLSDFLFDCAERIIVLKVIYKRLLNRFYKFLLYMGYTSDGAREVKPGQFCKTLSEFALEYRTMREKLLTIKQKKLSEKERKKTRGKMIVETNEKFSARTRTLPIERERDEDLKKILDIGLGLDKTNSLLLPGAKARKRNILAPNKLEINLNKSSTNLKMCSKDSGHASETEGGMEDMLEAVVKSAAKNDSTRPGGFRVKTSDRKSWRSTNYL